MFKELLELLGRRLLHIGVVFGFAACCFAIGKWDIPNVFQWDMCILGIVAPLLAMYILKLIGDNTKEVNKYKRLYKLYKKKHHEWMDEKYGPNSF